MVLSFPNGIKRLDWLEMEGWLRFYDAWVGCVALNMHVSLLRFGLIYIWREGEKGDKRRYAWKVKDEKRHSDEIQRARIHKDPKRGQSKSKWNSLIVLCLPACAIQSDAKLHVFRVVLTRTGR
jgi:hypothetical protein